MPTPTRATYMQPDTTLFISTNFARIITIPLNMVHATNTPVLVNTATALVMNGINAMDTIFMAVNMAEAWVSPIPMLKVT